MQEKPGALIFFLLLSLVQATNAVTEALYFGGKWENAYLFGSSFVLTVLVLFATKVLLLRQRNRRGASGKDAVPDVAGMPPFTCHSFTRYLIMIGIALFIAGVYWVALYTHWAGPHVPGAYRSGLHALAAVVIGLAGFLVADALRAYQRFRREGATAARMQSW